MTGAAPDQAPFAGATGHLPSAVLLPSAAGALAQVSELVMDDMQVELVGSLGGDLVRHRRLKGKGFAFGMRELLEPYCPYQSSLGRDRILLLHGIAHGWVLELPIEAFLLVPFERPLSLPAPPCHADNGLRQHPVRPSPSRALLLQQ
jgi:hypothetical protein